MKLGVFSTLLVSLSVSISSIAGVEEYSGNTICYVFKSAKLLKKMSCPYVRTAGASVSYAFSYSTYKLAGLGVMETVTHQEMDTNGSTLSFVVSLNNEKAVTRFRKKNNLKIVSDRYAEKYHKNVVYCFKSKQTPWEICTEDSGD